MSFPVKAVVLDWAARRPRYAALAGAAPLLWGLAAVSAVLTAALGIAGAFLSTWIGQSIGWYGPDQGAGLIGATIGAVVVLVLWHHLAVQRVVSDPGVSRADWPPPRR